MGSDKDSAKVSANALYDLLKLVKGPAGNLIRERLIKDLPGNLSTNFSPVEILTIQYNDWAKRMAPPMLIEPGTGPTARHPDYSAHKSGCEQFKRQGRVCTCDDQPNPEPVSVGNQGHAKWCESNDHGSKACNCRNTSDV